MYVMLRVKWDTFRLFRTVREETPIRTTKDKLDRLPVVPITAGKLIISSAGRTEGGGSGAKCPPRTHDWIVRGFFQCADKHEALLHDLLHLSSYESVLGSRTAPDRVVVPRPSSSSPDSFNTFEALSRDSLPSQRSG
jgi:hypothetical protein